MPEQIQPQRICGGNSRPQRLGCTAGEPNLYPQESVATFNTETLQVESRVVVDFTGEKRNFYNAGPTLQHDHRETAETQDAELTSRYCSQVGCCANDIILPDQQLDELLFTKFYTLENPTLLQPIKDGADLKDDRLLLPERAPGFVLRSRKWAWLDIALLREVPYGLNSWKDLVIDPAHKKKVLALVENHTGAGGKASSVQDDQTSVTQNMDLVQGKGRGLIMLLHGEPGVGKTSTAECVADHTKRPLFPVRSFSPLSFLRGLTNPYR